MNLSEIFSGAVTPAKWRALGEFLAGRTVRGGVGARVRTVGNHVIISAKRKGRAGGASNEICAFGQITTWEDGDPAVLKTGIAGGVIICGDQTWNFDPQELNLASAGTWLVSLDVTATVNMDDDAELLLPGIETGTKPTSWTKTVWTTGTDYPDGTNPSVPTGEGTIILPLGKLIIADGKATFENTGCGNFEVKHCSGTLSYSRSS